MSLGPLMVDIAGTELMPDDIDVLSHPLVGSVILFSRNYHNPNQVASLCAAIRALRTPSLLIAVDQEGGRVQRFREGFTRLPPLRTLGRRYDQERREARRARPRNRGHVVSADRSELERKRAPDRAYTHDGGPHRRHDRLRHTRRHQRHLG